MRHLVVVLLVTCVAISSELRGQETVQLGIPGVPLPARSLSDVWRLSTVVVVGAVAKSSAPTLDRSMVSRVQTVNIDEVLKGPRSLTPGSQIHVRILGGTIRSNGTEHRSAYEIEPLLTSERLILFLSEVPGKPGDTQLYELTVGASSVIRRPETSPTVKLDPRSPASLAELKGRTTVPFDEIASFLRSLR